MSGGELGTDGPELGSPAPDSHRGTLAASPTPNRRRANRAAATAAVWVNLCVLVVYRGLFGRVGLIPIVNDWATLFTSVMLQALPFLVLGVVVSAAISSHIRRFADERGVRVPGV